MSFEFISLVNWILKTEVTSIRTSKIKKIMAVPNSQDDAEKLNSSYIAIGNVKWYNHSGEELGSLLQN